MISFYKKILSACMVYILKDYIWFYILTCVIQRFCSLSSRWCFRYHCTLLGPIIIFIFFLFIWRFCSTNATFLQLSITLLFQKATRMCAVFRSSFSLPKVNVYEINLNFIALLMRREKKRGGCSIIVKLCHLVVFFCLLFLFLEF